MEEIKTDLIKIEPIVELIKAFVPDADEKTGRAVKAMEAITSIETDEELEQVNGLLVKVKPSYDKYSTLRKAITEPLDQLKAELMQYEKRVAYDGKSDNQYTRLRNLVAQYQQQKLDKIKEAEEAARKKKEFEDYKVDLSTQIKQKLVNLVMDRVVETEEWFKKYFDETTLENWDERVKLPMSLKPGLNEKYYIQCMTVVYDIRKITVEQFNEFLENIKKEEPYDKWKALVIEGLTPIMNEWRAKIPAIKSQKIELANASAKDKERIAQEQKMQADAEAERKRQDFANLQKQANDTIAKEGELNKMSNAFVEQASVQQMGDKGLVKKVMKFTKPELVPKALSTIIFHVLGHPKFPGIQKRDAKKQLVVDEKGRPEYVEPVQKWLDFFVANCDAEVEGTKIEEDAKVIVRK